MSKTRRPFRMKEFEIIDQKSANKIGVDGVMIASWCDISPDSTRILDVGCGCGIITIMLAQRAKNAFVEGIDIEPDAVDEATENAQISPFSDRIRIYNKDFSELMNEIKSGMRERYDLIVSNPPFFNSGVDPGMSKRMLARHSGSLSPEILIRFASSCLNENGKLSIIAPYDNLDNYLICARQNNMSPEKICVIRGNPHSEPKRVMLSFSVNLMGSHDDKIIESKGLNVEELLIEEAPGIYSKEYIELGRPFYLKF